MHSTEEKLAAFERLLKIMGELREQCPWDRKQTFETLRHLTIEETYELSEAIMDADVDEMSYQADHIAPEVVDVIQNQPKAVPNFLRSAKDLTPEQWSVLQQQLDSMVGDKGSDDS